MEQKKIKKRILRYADYDELMPRKCGKLTFGSDEMFRRLLDNVHKLIQRLLGVGYACGDDRISYCNAATEDEVVW